MASKKKIEIARFDVAQAARTAAAAAATEHADYLEDQIEGLRTEATSQEAQAVAIAQARAILVKAGVTEL